MALRLQAAAGHTELLLCGHIVSLSSCPSQPTPGGEQRKAQGFVQIPAKFLVTPKGAQGPGWGCWLRCLRLAFGRTRVNQDVAFLRAWYAAGILIDALSPVAPMAHFR